MTELTTERRTYVWTRENGDFGIAYKLRSSWRRNFHSTQMLKVMIETRGREVGRRHFGGQVREMRRGVTFWKAVCAETRKHLFGEGR